MSGCMYCVNDADGNPGKCLRDGCVTCCSWHRQIYAYAPEPVSKQQVTVVEVDWRENVFGNSAPAIYPYGNTDAPHATPKIGELNTKDIQDEAPMCRCMAPTQHEIVCAKYFESRNLALSRERDRRPARIRQGLQSFAEAIAQCGCNGGCPKCSTWRKDLETLRELAGV